LLDESGQDVDGFPWRPSSALSKWLDPEQNKNFGDHYLEVDYDLQK